MTQSKREGIVTVNGVDFDHATIEALKNGNTFSGSYLDGVVISSEATSVTPTQSIPISGYGSALRPNVEGNIPAAGLVTQPDVTRFNQQAAERRLRELEEQDRLREEREELSPERLYASLMVLTRQVAKLQKQVAALEKANANQNVDK